tara:strand:- start:115 stop:492 length:378 start_codon:yes stop_codon:yes gene_type:complete
VVGGVIVGFAWWMPDTETSRGYFRFLPRNFSENLESFSLEEIEQIEELLSKENSASRQSEAIELIRIRELQKDQTLNDLLLVIVQSLNGNRNLRPPNTEDLIHQDVSDLLERLFTVRESLLKKLG